MKSRVFLLDKRPGLDFSEAEKYGELVTVTQKAHPCDIDGLIRVAKALTDIIDEDVDYIVLTVSAVSTMLAFILGSPDYLGNRCIRFLVFNAKTGTYEERLV